MANDKDVAEQFKKAMDAAEQRNGEKFAQAKAEGKANASALEVIDLSAADGGPETDVTIFDHAVAGIRRRIAEGKVKLVALCAVTAGDDETSSLEGITEVLTTSSMLDNQSLASMLDNNVSAAMANNVYTAVNQALQSRVTHIADYLLKHVVKSESAKDN